MPEVALGDKHRQQRADGGIARRIRQMTVDFRGGRAPGAPDHIHDLPLAAGQGIVIGMGGWHAVIMRGENGAVNSNAVFLAKRTCRACVVLLFF